jgi:hypothetical protein
MPDSAKRPAAHSVGAQLDHMSEAAYSTWPSAATHGGQSDPRPAITPAPISRRKPSGWFPAGPGEGIGLLCRQPEITRRQKVACTAVSQFLYQAVQAIGDEIPVL